MKLQLGSTLAVSLAMLAQTEAFHQQVIQPQSSFQKSAKSEPSLEDLWGSLWPYQGIQTFAHLEHNQCLLDKSQDFDIAVIGVPFDTDQEPDLAHKESESHLKDKHL